MVKKISQTASKPRASVTEDQVEALANQLADKPYGEDSAGQKAKPADEVKAKPRTLSISLPGGLIEKLEDAAHANKKSGQGQKSVSGIIRVALEAAGFKL